MLHKKLSHNAAKFEQAFSNAILDQTMDAVLVCDLDGKIVRANQAAHHLCGQNPLFKPFVSVLPLQRPLPGDLSSADPLTHREHGRLLTLPSAAETSHLRNVEVFLPVMAEQGQRNLMISTGPLLNENGIILGSIITLTDITEHKRVEIQVRQNQQWLRVTLASIGDAVIATDTNGHVTLLNPVAARLTGWKVAEALGQPLDHVFKIINEDTGQSSRDIFAEVLREKRLVDMGNNTAICCRDGRLIPIEHSAAPIIDDDGNLMGTVLTFHDATKRKEKERELLSLNRTLAVLTNSNRAMMHIKDETSYLSEICRLIVEGCGYTMVWIGFAENDAAKTIRPVACAGFETGYLDTVKLTWADTERGHGPTGIAVRTGQPSTCENMATDPAFSPWREDALQRGYASALALPLQSDGKVFGAITIYTSKIDQFHPGEVDLLHDLANDLSLGISVIRLRRARELADDQLLQAKAAAETANIAKSQFLAMMSHEIRTPLNAIMGFSELLAEPDQPPEDRCEFAQRVRRSGELLVHLIDDILDLSKIEAGRLQIEKIEVNIHELLADTVAIMRHQAEEKGLTFAMNSEDPLPKMFLSDPTRIKQILANIIGNAIKFTTRGEVRVVIRVDHIDHKLHIVVTDTGIGVSAEQARGLFQPFVQADISTTRKYGGTGLGLVLSRRLAQALGGDVIFIGGKPGQGCTFEITLAIEGAKYKVCPIESLDRTRKAGTRIDGIKVLLAEDVPDNQLLVGKFIIIAGGVVDFADDGEEAVAKALASDYDIVLMDIRMPKLDGYAATQKLRTQGYRVPIIALTAHAMREEIKRCKEVGCNAHLAKPVRRDELMELIFQLVSQQRAPIATSPGVDFLSSEADLPC